MGTIIKTSVRVIFTLLLITLIAVALLLLYVSRLELEEYRPTIEQRLSSALQQPVSIGSGSLKFRQGLTIELYQVEIGSPDKLYLHIPRLNATLSLVPLLNKKIILNNVEILSAKANLKLSRDDRPKTPPISLQESHYHTEIRMLTLRHAEVEIYSGATAEKPLLHLSNLHAMIYNWQPQQSSQLVISGQETESQASFLLETILPPLGGENWRSLDLKAELQIGRFQQQTQASGVRAALTQSGRINLTIDGVPAHGALVSVAAIQAGSSSPLVHGDGIWISTREAEQLENLQARLFGFPVSGHLNLEHHPQRKLVAQLESCDLLVTADDFTGIDLIERAGFVTGNLDHLLLRLEHHWHETESTDRPMQIDGHFKLSDISWQEPYPWSIRDMESELLLSDSNLTLSGMEINTDLGTVQVQGQIHDIFSEQLFQLKATSAPLLETLLTELDLPDNWSLNGPLPLALEVSGSIDAPEFTLQADFYDSRLHLDRLYQKPHNRPSAISITGSLRQQDHIQLSRFDIHLEPLRVSGQATLRPWDKVLNASVTTEQIDLTSLSSINRIFNRLQLKGKAAAELFVSTDEWRGNIFLTDAGAHLTPLIGDLNRVHGEVAIDQSGLRFNKLPAHLGESSFTVSGDMEGWAEPVLKLDVSASTTRAQDLVFRNPQLTLYNLRGRLEIDRHSIRFDPVSVRLEDSTQATIFGSVNDFSRPRTDLSIHGERADVLEIINLFRDPTTPTATTSPVNTDREPVVIRVTAREGNLSGMRFTNARTTITDHNGVLSVYPLTFESGGGWSRAKVEYNRHDPVAPLKISGHVNGVDASIIHHDLFDQPGLIRGPLTGDFYLEGDPAGDTFWQHASGGLYFQVHNGTLRRFRGLAQVFSLLNVSQIFTGRLPDMDREGMPFNLLEGSARIRHGVLQTDDLKITGEAMNMSLVGKQDLANDTIDMVLGVMPLRTVDKVVSSIPIAGWLLAGEDRAVLTAYFRIEGESGNPSVTAVPVGSISNTVLGVFRRTFGLPEKLIRDLGSFLQTESEKKEEEE